MPATHIVIPATHIVIPATHIVIPATHIVIPATHIVIPAKAGIHTPKPRNPPHRHSGAGRNPEPR